MTSSTTPRLVAVVSDLMFTAKIMDAARRAGILVQFVSNAGQLDEALAAGTSGVVIDLGFAAIEPLETIRRIRARHPDLPVLGFLPHVETELRTEALAAGCTKAAPRSAFSKKMLEMLAELAGLTLQRD